MNTFATVIKLITFFLYIEPQYLLCMCTDMRKGRKKSVTTCMCIQHT